MEELVLKDGTSIQKSIKDVTYFPQGTRKYDFLYYLENVGIAQLISKTLFAPIERYRIIKQTWPSFSTTRKPFPTFINFLQRTWKEQNFSKYWHGNGPNCFMYVVQLMAQFNFFQNINKFWSWDTSSKYETMLANFMKVLSASTFTLLLTYPIETTKVRFSMEFYKKKQWNNYQSTLDGLWGTFRQNGLRGLYKGLPIGILTSTLYFYIYYTVGESLMISDIPVLLKSAAVSSLFAVIALYPLDTIKHRLQLDNMGQGVMHLNTRHILRQISNQKSFSSLYSGITPTICKHMLTFVTAMSLIKLKSQNGWNYF